MENFNRRGLFVFLFVCVIVLIAFVLIWEYGQGDAVDPAPPSVTPTEAVTVAVVPPSHTPDAQPSATAVVTRTSLPLDTPSATTVVPTPTAIPTATPTPTAESVLHTVKSGDTMSHLSLAYYGRAVLWPKICSANGRLLPYQCHLIYPGETLAIPNLGE